MRHATAAVAVASSRCGTCETARNVHVSPPTLSVFVCPWCPQEFGPEWAKEHLVPQVLAMVKNPHYLYRMTVLVAISSLANYVSQEVFVSTMLPVLVQCAKDRVPNVKFNVAKVKRCCLEWLWVGHDGASTERARRELHCVGHE
jgi:hypothetical protein